MKFLDKIPVPLLALPAIFLAVAPFNPPHLWEKLNMLINGTLTRPIDIFDLFWHSIFLILLGLKLLRMAWLKRQTDQDS